ncbi:hypothetical protein RGQ13_15850 [Thalassotalea psychrophila]|uniref:Lipoprotein n=1 Tax=Thalassotalea psychrophila TaxID=3065647 RepID=A0ABY9TRY9_9GAMM|nr:hypothetical protein RGQ13_15850 [Colwelliaceae bacterium SQ149]
MYQHIKAYRSSLLFIGSVFILCSCAKPQEQLQHDSQIQVLIPDIAPSDIQHELTEIEIKEVELPDNNTMPLIARHSTNNNIQQDNNVDTSAPANLGFIINQEICRESIVSYKVADESGYINTHRTKAQAQATIIEVNNKQIKLMISGWYSRDKNLYHWQPYLKEQPMMGLMRLDKGKVYWDDKTNWYLCSFNAGEII